MNECRPGNIPDPGECVHQFLRFPVPARPAAFSTTQTKRSCMSASGRAVSGVVTSGRMLDFVLLLFRGLRVFLLLLFLFAVAGLLLLSIEFGSRFRGHFQLG